MAKNDTLLLDGIIDERVELKLPSNRRDEAFEYLAFEQILKDNDLSYDEIQCGSVDGRNDGGIDGFFILINGHMLTDPESFPWPKSGSQLEVWIITCKHHDTFKQAPLDNLVASVTELFDLSLGQDQLNGEYSESILNCRENLKFSYRKVSPRMTKFSVNISYASRGDTSILGDSILARSEQINSITKEAFGSCDASFDFFGASELVEMHRKMPNFCLELPFSEVLASGERYVLLANLKDYFGFITDDGKLRRYLFDSNVRDFMGLNRVNEDIRTTLDNESSPDFWWLNNGITILATSASVIGDSIQLQDIQIVNGLQTTESIFRYFESGGKDPKQRSVLIKIIVSQEEAVRDTIIRATNNQTDVEIASLHATDKIQRDIEDILGQCGLFYERRKNFYHNSGQPSAKIVTPLYLAAGYVNLILKSPQKATRLRSRFMRSSESYERVFSEKAPILVWPKIAKIMKRTDEVLEKLRPVGSAANEKFLKKWRQITSFITVSRILGTFDFCATELIQMDEQLISADEFELTWKFIAKNRAGEISGTSLRKKSFYTSSCTEAAKEFAITKKERIEKIKFFHANGPSRSESYSSLSNCVDMEFAQKVNHLLPAQPWKPGVHKIVTQKLECSNKEYFQAVKLLIDEGLRNKQVDGVVYDSEGNVICFDAERVNPETFSLIEEDDA